MFIKVLSIFFWIDVGIFNELFCNQPFQKTRLLYCVFLLCLLHCFLLEGLMSLLREMGKGYLALCSYNCKEAINILSHLPSHHYNTGWVLCQIGRAYFELSEYMQVSMKNSYICLSRDNLNLIKMLMLEKPRYKGSVFIM